MTGRQVGPQRQSAEGCPLREAAPIGHLAGDGTAVRAVAAVFESLGSPVRLRVVGILLRRGPATRAELSAMLGTRRSDLEYHLGMLRAAGPVTTTAGSPQARHGVVDGMQAGLATLYTAEQVSARPTVGAVARDAADKTL